MRARLLLAVAGLVAATAAPASAAPAPTGLSCGLVAENDDVTSPPNLYTGVIWGGPVVLGDDTNPAVVYSGSMTCTVQVNAPRHADPDSCNGTGPTTGVVAALPPTLCSYFATPGDVIFLCTQVNIVGGPTLYWDAVAKAWSTNPFVPCNLAITIACENTALPCGVKPQLIDPLICPILAIFFPPQGDVGIFWDCPPYQSNPPLNLYGHVVIPEPVA